MRRTQLICSRCGEEDVTLFGEKPDHPFDRAPYLRKRETRVRCDGCRHKGPTRSFLRIRLTRNGISFIRPEVQCVISGRIYQGELRGKRGKEFKFVGVGGSEHIEIWLPRAQIALL